MVNLVCYYGLLATTAKSERNILTLFENTNAWFYINTNAWFYIKAIHSAETSIKPIWFIGCSSTGCQAYPKPP